MLKGLIIGICLGLIIGCCVGIFVAGMCNVAAEEDKFWEEVREEMK